ncbi:MAG TPA: response regulator [Terracidiphilus sp.]|nr:response regulator [Terracidiphilus sp.]
MQGAPDGFYAGSEYLESPARGIPKEKQDGHEGGVEPHRVLVVDDERLIADSVAAILNRSGYRATSCYSGIEAIESIGKECPDIIVSDVVMPDLNGIQLAKLVRNLCPAARIVLFSGNIETAGLLDDASLDGYFFEILPKPIHPLQLLKALKGPVA